MPSETLKTAPASASDAHALADGAQLERDPALVLAELDAARQRTLALVEGLDDDAMTRVYSPIMSPLVWDLGHIAAYEDLWLGHRLAGLALLRADLAELYDAFETPRAVRGRIPMLGPSEARAYMVAVRGRVAKAIAREGAGDGLLCEMVTRHELQHTETMRQTMAIAGLFAAGEPRLGPMAAPQGWHELPAARFHIGAGPQGFAY